MPGEKLQTEAAGRPSQIVDALKDWGFAGLAAGAAVFSLLPAIDLDISRQFVTPGHEFAGNTPQIELVRNIFKLVFVLSCAAALGSLIYSLRYRRSCFGLSAVQSLFLVTCFVLGPGVITNQVFKDHWGRARPREVVQFGGEKAFTPALVPSRQCKRNCSFVSGEASSVFMVFFAAGIVFARFSVPLMLCGVVFGALAGLIRMAQGGHFLSDVIFAGVAMALAVALAYHAFQLVWPGCLEEAQERA